MTRSDKSYKIIIDTNIWISFLIGKSLKGLQKHLDSKHILVITCDEQIHELIEVFYKPKVMKYISPIQVDEFFDLLEESSEKLVLTTTSDLCRDKKDNYLVSLAIESNADYLITGNVDLLELNPIQGTQVLRYTDFNLIIS